MRRGHLQHGIPGFIEQRLAHGAFSRPLRQCPRLIGKIHLINIDPRIQTGGPLDHLQCGHVMAAGLHSQTGLIKPIR